VSTKLFVDQSEEENLRDGMIALEVRGCDIDGTFGLLFNIDSDATIGPLLLKCASKARIGLQYDNKRQH
jgi:hypothetical protein